MRTSIVFFLITYVVIMISFNNCSAVHENSNNLSSFETCNLILKDEFANKYHNFLRTNCNNCHVNSDSGNGAFADSDLEIAFDAFVVRGNNLVGQRAIDPNHKPPYSGTHLTDEVSALDSTWNTAKIQADNCASLAGHSNTNIDGGIIPDDPVPSQGTITTFIKFLNADKDPKTLTWDLGNEIKTPGISFNNAELSIDVVANTTITGEKSYIFMNPKLKAGDVSIHLMYIDFIINNQLVSAATSYHSINRRVPAGESRDLAVGATTFGFNVQSTDTVALSLGTLTQIDFNPPTYAELVAPSGVIGANCLNCHDANSSQGGLDLSSRDMVLQQLMVSPYNPNNSEVFKRMNDAQSPMPQGGRLPQADIDQVLHWIQDGAR